MSHTCDLSKMILIHEFMWGVVRGVIAGVTLILMSDTNTLNLHYGNRIIGNVKIYNFRCGVWLVYVKLTWVVDSLAV